ncbi:MAG TPA: PKD domain-containing protein, partial [Bacteroidia bacterium]
GGGAEPFANFITDPATISIFDPLVNFINTSTGNPVSWSWNFGDTTSGTNNISSNQNPSHVYSDTGLYCVTLIITDSTGVCKDTSTQCIRVDAPFTFYVPNAFTPNQDGRNEEFKAYGTYIREYHMAIFDRWGNLIFESNDINTGWNGKVKNRSVSPEEEDVYIWKAEITDIHYVVHKFIGHVSMLK